MAFRSKFIAVGGLCVVALAATPCHDSVACGAFFTASLNAPIRPSLAYEQVLLVHDDKLGREHFIREVTFDRANESFGFVVPTPTRPEVASVAASPFATLRSKFPFVDPLAQPLRGGGGGTGDGFGVGHGRGVTVLEEARIGSFNAFVLAADDPTALAGWLAQHKLTTTHEAEPWLAHYVKMKFFYVAMKYDPTLADFGADARRKLQMETARISFDTPIPFYPYFEPDPKPGASPMPLERSRFKGFANEATKFT